MDGGKVNNIIRIPTSLNGNFFKHWLVFLAPFHGLSDRCMEIAAALLKERFDLSKVIADENLLDKVLMGDEIRTKIRNSFEMTSANYQMVLGKLKKAKFLVDGRINPKFIPKNLTDEDNAFQLLIYFDLDE